VLGQLIYEENPPWGPKIGSTVIIKNPNYREIFLGKVYKTIWNNTAAIIVLLNNRDYTEIAFLTQNILGKTGGQGLFLLLPSYSWKYVDDQTFELIKNLNSKDLTNLINKNINQKYSEFIDKIDNNIDFNNKINSNNSQLDLLNDIKFAKNAKIINKKDKEMENIEEIEDTSLLTKKEDIDNENIFKEKEINKVLFDYKEKFTTPSPLIIKLLKRKLLLTQEIPENEKKIIVNNSIAVKNLILHKEDEENEGRKIIKYIIDTMMMTKKLNKENTIEIFTDLKMSIFNGYVHIARKGLQVSDKITGDLIPNLKYFNWQYNIPIDYDTLKYVFYAQCHF
jgi:hypothetical protein